MIQHTISYKESAYDCFNRSRIYQTILDAYGVHHDTDNYIFESTCELGAATPKADCKVLFEKSSNLYIWTFSIDRKLIPIDCDYTMSIIPKTDIFKIEIERIHQQDILCPKITATLHFKSNTAINFTIENCTIEKSDKIIQFLNGLMN